MKSTALTYLNFIKDAFVVNMKATMEYRVNFILQFFGMILNNAAFAIFWYILIGRAGNVGGYTFSDVMLVWAIVSTSFGFAHIVFGNVRMLGRIVMDGSLDVYLLQPKNVWINLLVSKTNVSAWGDFAYGFIVLFLSSGFNLERFFLFLAISIPAAFVFVSIFSISESLVFYIGNSTAISQSLNQFLLSFSLYPEKIFGEGMRWMFYTIIPSGFIAFIPLNIFNTLNWKMVPFLWFIAAIYTVLAYLFFCHGLKRYESGNKMDARI